MKPLKSLLPAVDDTATKALVDVQTAITRVKEIITYNVSHGADEKETVSQLNKAIADECKRVSNVGLREQMRASLVSAARAWHFILKEQYRTLDAHLVNANQRQPLGIDINNLMAKTPYQKEIEFAKILDDGTAPGLPIIRDYRNSVKAALRALAAEPPKVVTRKDGATYIMPLRNRAELATRYDAHVKAVADLQDSGTEFAWTSSHPNCSPRCKDYQGRLWSLIGKSGNIDGIPYRPIDEALKGKNGDGNGIISGYNCRHRLIAYTKGSHAPQDYTEAEIKHEYDIDKRQRDYENRIRHMKTEERELRAAGFTKEAAALRKKWRRLTADYQIFSVENDRAYYPDRYIIDRAELTSMNSANDVDNFGNDGIINIDIYPDKLSDVPRGKPMNFIEANGKKANPNYDKGGGYKENCQSCVVAYEARRRGYDIEALPFDNNLVARRLALQTNLAWINPESGKHPEYIIDTRVKTLRALKEFLHEQVKENERYTLEWKWKRKDGHIISVDKDEKGVRLYDPQTGKVIREDDMSAYFGNEIAFSRTTLGEKHATPPKLLRVDNMRFNDNITNGILKKGTDNEIK